MKHFLSKIITKGGDYLAIYEFEGKKPLIGKGSYVFESSDVIGDVQLGEGCYVGAGARIRGDYGKIEIGAHTAVEDNCVIHARPNEKTIIGSHVTIGHGAIIHNATICDWVVLGMGSIVSDWANVGEWAVVGEGAVVRNKQVIPPGKIAVGVPAKIIADVTDEYKEQWTGFKALYTSFASKRYPKGLRRIDEVQGC